MTGLQESITQSLSSSRLKLTQLSWSWAQGHASRQAGLTTAPIPPALLKVVSMEETPGKLAGCPLFCHPGQIWDCLAFFTFCVLSETHISIPPTRLPGKTIKINGTWAKGDWKSIVDRDQGPLFLIISPYLLGHDSLMFPPLFLAKDSVVPSNASGEMKIPNSKQERAFSFYRVALVSSFSLLAATLCFIPSSFLSDKEQLKWLHHGGGFPTRSEHRALWRAGMVSLKPCLPPSLLSPIPYCSGSGYLDKTSILTSGSFPGTKHNMPVTSPDKPAPLFPLASWN